MEGWPHLLDPGSAPDMRATALRDHLPVDSPWRQEVLRNDVRLWELFPAECAVFTTDAEDHQDHASYGSGSNTDSDTCTNMASPMDCFHHPASIPQLQVLAADVCTRLAAYACATSVAAASTCADVDAKQHVVQALAQLRAILRQFDVTAAKHEEVATLALETARAQHQAMQELSRVVQQAADDVATAVLNVKSAVDTESRDAVDSAVRQRVNVRGMAVDSVNAASRKCVECGIGATYLEESSIGSQTRAFLDQMEGDADSDATRQTLVQVCDVSLCGTVAVGLIVSGVSEVEDCRGSLL